MSIRLKGTGAAIVTLLPYALLPVIKLLFADGKPAGVKAAPEIKGVVKNNPRLPLVKADEAVYFALQKLLQNRFAG